jgi:transposase-like protein
MALSRRQFTRESKQAAVRRLELGASIAEVARASEVVSDRLHYLRLLEHESSALEQAAPLAGWTSPSTLVPIQRLTSRCRNCRRAYR